MALPEGPQSRAEQYLARIAGQTGPLPEAPRSRVEQYLDYIAENGTVSEEEIAEQVSTWLEENIHEDPTVVIDSSLSVSGAAADAKAAGDELSVVKGVINGMNVAPVELNKAVGYISNATKNWAGIGTSSYAAYTIIPVHGGEHIEVTNNSERSSIIAALTSYSQPATDDTPAYSAVEGWTSIISIGSTTSVTTFTGTLPLDANYFYVQVNAYMPASVKINGYDYLKSLTDNFQSIAESKSEELHVPALSTFDSIGIVGDSWSAGAVYTAASTYSHYPKLRWGYIASKMFGFTPAFFAASGATTQTWLTKSAGLAAMQAADAQELYICCLGINDHAHDYAIGTTTDMDSESADTFYGSYGKIIRAIKTKAPYAKIALALIPAYNSSANVSSYNTAIRNLAEHFSIGLLDTEIDGFFNSELFENDRQWNHLTAVGYTAMASAINSMLAKDYEVNREYWRYSTIEN